MGALCSGKSETPMALEPHVIKVQKKSGPAKTEPSNDYNVSEPANGVEDVNNKLQIDQKEVMNIQVADYLKKNEEQERRKREEEEQRRVEEVKR